MKNALEELVNIGPALAADLGDMGIRDAGDLRELGAIEVGRRLEAAGKHDCINAVLAVEGAIRGRRWMSMPAEDRARLAHEWAQR